MSVPLADARGRILLVDDDALVRTAYTRALESRGHEVETTHAGELAVGLLARRDFDVVLTDVRMGGMDGVDL
ncbi:MAG: response regulator, partial [Myxococcales bacterium]